MDACKRALAAAEQQASQEAARAKQLAECHDRHKRTSAKVLNLLCNMPWACPAADMLAACRQLLCMPWLSPHRSKHYAGDGCVVSTAGWLRSCSSGRGAGERGGASAGGEHSRAQQAASAVPGAGREAGPDSARRRRLSPAYAPGARTSPASSPRGTAQLQGRWWPRAFVVLTPTGSLFLAAGAVS